jgi:two-component sensor histidine kinase
MTQRTPTLLYIDDDGALARLVDRGLTRRGYKVIHAASGEEGLERIRSAGAQDSGEGCIDVVALDQYMPGLDGLETLEQIMAIPDAPPVVFVTASQDSSIAVTALKAGAADYLVKDVKGDFIPLLHVAAEGALRQAELQRAREEAEAEIHASRDRYAALAAERELLLREVNHRVGNSLQIIASLLHLQASSAGQEEVKAALTNAMGRVAAVAQVHRRLYTSQDLKSVVLSQYLDALLEDLRRSAEGNRMSRLTLKAEPIEIDPDRAVAIGIIVNELVMNAVKYAYPDGAGPIHVVLNGHGDDLELSIADDGVGLNVKTDPRSTGMGQRIVTAMAQKLDANVERDPAHTGTRIVLRFRRVSAPPTAPAKPASAA